VFGGVYINASIGEFVAFYRDVKSLLEDQVYLDVQEFEESGTTAKLSDFDRLTFRHKDIDAIQKCKPNRCDFQVSDVAGFQKQINWRSSDKYEQVNKLAAGGSLNSPINAALHSADGTSADYTLHIKTSRFGSRTSESSPLSHITVSFLGRCFVLRRVAKSPSRFLTTRTCLNSCIGLVKKFPPTWMESLKRARHLVPHKAAGGSRSAKSGWIGYYHTHNRAGADLASGLYGGEVGPAYIEPVQEPGSYDREMFLILKEFEPSLSRGSDMPQDFLFPMEPQKELKEIGEASMKASPAKGMLHGYEVGYRSFTINGRTLGHGERPA
jgi:hypothetical protein